MAGLWNMEYLGFVFNRISLAFNSLFYLLMTVYGLTIFNTVSGKYLVAMGILCITINTLIFLYFEKRKNLFKKQNAHDKEYIDNQIKVSCVCPRCQQKLIVKYNVEDGKTPTTLSLRCFSCENKFKLRLNDSFISAPNKIKPKHIIILVLCLALIGVIVASVMYARSDSRYAVKQGISSSVTTAKYIGNANSHKFHKKSCTHLPDKGNQVYYSTREQAVKDGMKPCKVCNP